MDSAHSKSGVKRERERRRLWDARLVIERVSQKRKSLSNTLAKLMVGVGDATGQQQQNKEKQRKI